MGYRRILIVRGPYGLPIETSHRSHCGQSLEREPLGHWFAAGSLVPTRELTHASLR